MKMIFNVCILLIFISFTKIYCLNVHQIIASSLKDCKIKYFNQSWLDVDDCDRTSWNESWEGASMNTGDIYIDYNIGDKLNITVKFYNNLPPFDNYCSIYFTLKVNEYLVDNNHDYIYYCSNCGCTQSIGEKTYCHKLGGKIQYCKPVAGKEYNFYIRINGLHELDLMNATIHNKNYYELIGTQFYLEDNQEIMPLKFSSDTVLKVVADSRHKVNLDELLIKYSIKGEGEFYTIKNKKLNNSGTIGEDIYFKKPIDITGNQLHSTKLEVSTIAKFGYDKYNSTSNNAEFIFNYCSNGYKINKKNQSCYKCYESCFNCSEEGKNYRHNCYECNSNHPYYYITENNMKNCYSSCKNAKKIRKNKDSKICIDEEDCDAYISSDEETCVNNCSQNSEYFFNDDGKVSKNCINFCDYFISEDNTNCVTKCSYINQLTDLTINKCITKCPSNLFYTPEKNSCSKKCEVPYKYYIDYKNNTKKCVKACNEYPYIVENNENFECLIFHKFKIISIESNSLCHINQSDFPKYSINQQNIDNLKIRVNFNQNIGNRIILNNGKYEIIPQEKNSIIINIEEFNEKQSFIFKDNLDDSYDFGFELEITNIKKNNLNIILIIMTSILFAGFVIVLILFIVEKRKKNRINLNEVNDFFG